MAVAKRTTGQTAESTTPRWRVAGEHKVTLYLDENEAEAVAHALFYKEFTAHWLDARSSDPTSLRSSGARVHAVLAEIGVSG